MKTQAPEKITVCLKKNNAPAHIKKALDMIIYELEHFGRTSTNCGAASRFLSQRMKSPKNQEKIYFSWNKQHQKSMITLATSTKLERVSSNKVRLVYQKSFLPKNK